MLHRTVIEAVWAGEIEPEIVVDELMVTDAGLTLQDMLEPPFKTVMDRGKLVAPRWSSSPAQKDRMR